MNLELPPLIGEFDDMCPIDDVQDCLFLPPQCTEHSDIENVAVLGYN
jgi:hypothetical protein